MWIRSSPTHYVNPGKGSSVSAILAALKQCGKGGDLEEGRRLHSNILEAGYHTNKYVANTLVTMYAKCRSMGDARDVFDSMLHRDVVLWTSLILGYTENGQSRVAMDLFTRMDCEPDSVTFVAALKACAGLAVTDRQFCLEKGTALHRQVKERGFDADIFVATNLVEMYRKCGSMMNARDVFNKMARRNAVSWTSLILGYVENEESSEAMDLFLRMDCEPDYVTFVAALKACAGLASEERSNRQFCLEKGMDIHRRVKERGLATDGKVASNLVDMYSKCGSMSDAREVFDSMVQWDVVSWNIVVLGYVENGESSLAMDLFMNMKCEPDSFTFVAALKACGSLGELQDGRGIHTQICKLGFEEDGLVATTLVDLYGKCGNMVAAEMVFNELHTWDNIVSWNVLVAAYSSTGDSTRVFNLVRTMHQGGLQMNGITWVLILTVCSHGGLVEEGRKYFQNMSRYGIVPTVEHYTCMVDMLGRANRLQEALSTVRSMPFEGDSVVWRALLWACRNWNNMDVGKVAFDALVARDNKDSSAYVLMGDIYKKLGMQQDWDALVGDTMDGVEKTM